MDRFGVATAVVLATVLASSLVTVVAAAPPRPGTEENGLSENESATLWSRDDDSRYISNEAYREAYGEDRTAIQQAANGTDITFKRPPATAATWTRNDFRDFQPGGQNVSVYPAGATLEDSVYIRDAHATLFAVQPSTVAHVYPGTTTRYVAPEGRLLGTVDYRVRSPSPLSGNGSQSVTHSITEVRLKQNGEVVQRTDGTHRPAFAYDIDGHETTLTLEADIEVRIRKRVRADGNQSQGTVSGRAPNGTAVNATGGNQSVRMVTDSVTVSDSLDVTVYDLEPTFRYARYPDRDRGVAITQSEPWQGYSLGTGSKRVRGVWRFYTARDTGWDTLERSQANGSTRIDSPARPVQVHAYPSKLGPRVEPAGVGPELLEYWGGVRSSPADTIGSNVTVDVVPESYQTTYGLAVRYEPEGSEAVTIHGIVRGSEVTLRPGRDGRRRTVRSANLTVERVATTEEFVRVRIELRDETTGDPIALELPNRSPEEPIIVDDRAGYITIGDRRVQTNASGMATVRLEKAGVYTVRYHPASWLEQDPAYAGTTATVRWHPLSTARGWLVFAVEVFQWFLPFAVALYAGRQLGGLFDYEGEFR